MTWQRIDENTYIDDTLVTCAEYQLFIDEMREQGKYYQPDHWTSYQFPAGKARKPIVGVRSTDVFFFCEWLTKQGGGDWCYRLPTHDETQNYHLQSIITTSNGFWNSSDGYEFVVNGYGVPNFYELDVSNSVSSVKIEGSVYKDNSYTKNDSESLYLALDRSKLLTINHASLILNTLEWDIDRAWKFYTAMTRDDLQIALNLGYDFAINNSSI